MINSSTVRTIALLSLLACALVCEPCRGETSLHASVEWWTDISETVIQAEVSEVKELKIPSLDWKSQRVTFKTATVVKGSRLDGLTTTQEYVDLNRFVGSKNYRLERALRAGDKVLVFCARRDPKGDPEVAFWVGLSRPADSITANAAYDNDGKWLNNQAAILERVKRHLEKADRVKAVGNRGLIVPFPDSGAPLGLIRTADPEYRQVLVKQLREGNEFAIYNLISYPGKETEDLITPFLKDNENSQKEVSNGIGADGKPAIRTVRVYPVRQLAYTALTLLGREPAQPDGFVAGETPSHFEEYFENKARFPFGEWKRFDFPPRPAKPIGKVPPESIEQVAVSDFVAALERVAAEEKKNYHRLLWRAYHLARNSTIGRPWNEVEPKLNGPNVKKSAPSEHQFGTSITCRFRAARYLAANQVDHELEIEFNVVTEADAEKLSVARISSVSVTLIAKINKPFAEFARANPYPAGTVAAKAIASPKVTEGAKTCPILEKITIRYWFLFDRWEDYSPHGFDVDLLFVDRVDNQSAGKSITARAACGLDPQQDWLSRKVLEGFHSQDTLSELAVDVGIEWSSDRGTRSHELCRVGTNPFSGVHELWSDVFSGADVRALPAMTRRVKIREGEFSRQAIKELSRLADLESLDLKDDTASDEDLETIAALPKLRHLHLRGLRITDSGIANLARSAALESLVIWDAPNLTDDCCRSLAKIKGLRRLSVGYSKMNFTINGLKSLSSLSELEELDLGGVGGDRGLEVISGFAKLKVLKVSRSDQITSDGMAHLTKLRSLKWLTIGHNTSVNDECFRHIGKIESLETLRLFGVSITDAGLNHLAGLRKLSYLGIYDSPKVTEKGLAQLESKLPGRFQRK